MSAIDVFVILLAIIIGLLNIFRIIRAIAKWYIRKVRADVISEYQRNLSTLIIAWQNQNISEDTASYECIVHETLETVMDAVNGIAWQMKGGAE